MTANFTHITLKVEVDFDDDGSFATAGDDISAYVQMIESIDLGLGDDMSRIANVGACTIRLSNSTRKFSPAYTSGAYYGKLLPDLPVRVTVTDGVTNWVVFYGYTKKWTPTAGRYADRICTLECQDLLGVIQDKLIAIPLQFNVTADTLVKAVVNYALSAPVASQPLTIAVGNVANNDIYAVGGATYKFVTSLSGAANEVKIGADNAATAVNLAAAINQDAGIGSTYGSGTVRNPQVSASASAGVVTLTALLRGASGNSITNWKSATTALQMGTRTELDIVKTQNAWQQLGQNTGDMKYVGQTFTPPSGVVISHILIYFGASANNPSGQVTLQLFDEYGGSVVSSFTPTASAWNTIPVALGVATAGGQWRFRLTCASQGATRYWNVGTQSGNPYADGTAEAYASGAWSDIAGVDLESYLFYEEYHLTGGADYPSSPAPTLDTGVRSFDVAADRWSQEAKVNCMSALEDTVKSEWGMLWVAKDGTLTFKNGDYFFLQAAVAAALTLSSELNALDGSVDRDKVYRRVEVAYTPRAQLASGVIAKSNSTTQVPGQSGTERWNGTVALPGGGSIVVKLPFIDPATSLPMGAQSIVTPLVPTTDWTANELSGGNGVDYTGSPSLTFSLAINGANVEISIKNTALGPLYITKLQVRGVGLPAYNPTVKASEDATVTIDRTLNVDLPLPVPDNFAQSLADYLLSRYKTESFRTVSLAFQNQNKIGSVNLFSLNVGDILAVSEHQTGMTSERFLIIGIGYSNITRSTSSITLTLVRLDDLAGYGIYDDAALGLYDTAIYSL